MPINASPWPIGAPAATSLRPSRLASSTADAPLVSPATVIPAGGVMALVAAAGLLARVANTVAAASAAPTAVKWRLVLIMIVVLSWRVGPTPRAWVHLSVRHRRNSVRATGRDLRRFVTGPSRLDDASPAIDSQAPCCSASPAGASSGAILVLVVPTTRTAGPNGVGFGTGSAHLAPDQPARIGPGMWSPLRLRVKTRTSNRSQLYPQGVYLMVTRSCREPRTSPCRDQRPPPWRTRWSRQACGARSGDVPTPVLAQSRAHHPTGRDERDGDEVVRLLARSSVDGLVRPGARIARVLVGWLAVPRRGRRRATRSPAGDDAADLHGNRRRLHRVDGDQSRLARPRVLVGAGGAGDDHAARPLAGDESDWPGTQRPRRARRTAPGRSRPDRWRRDSGGARCRFAGR